MSIVAGDYSFHGDLVLHGRVGFGALSPSVYDEVNDRFGLGTSVPTHMLTLAASKDIALYNTADQVTNYERGYIRWVSNSLNIGTEKGGSGTNQGIKVNCGDGTYLSMGGNEFALGTGAGAAAAHVYAITDNVSLKLSGRIGNQASRPVIALDNANGGPDFSATAGTQIGLQFTSAVNQTVTAGYTGFLLNMTETSTGSGTKLLADFQTGGVSRASISNLGDITSTTAFVLGTSIRMYANGGHLAVRNAADSAYVNITGAILIGNTGVRTVVTQNNGSMVAGVTGHLGWSDNSAGNAGNFDTSFARDAAGVIRAANASTGMAALKRLLLVNATPAGGAIASTISDTVTTNEGASARSDFTLPTAVAGLTYTFVVQDTDGIRVTAAAGDTLRIAASVSATAGLVESTTIGNVVTITAINATEWVATHVVGTWTVT